MALDQGTTSSRCILFDGEKPIASAQNEFRQIYPRAGWVEHSPYDIWESQYGAAREALRRSGLAANEISAIGITNQRETTLVWDRKTGEPLYNAIVWQCRRTSQVCEKLKRSGAEDMIRSKTGLVIDAYFSATKLMWLLENVPGLRERAEAGEVAFGTPDTWLVWMLTAGRLHITDYTNASRTMLFNIGSLSWDADLLSLFNIPRCMLPEVVPSSGLAGFTSPELFGCAIPIAGIAGDQQAALFGQKCRYAGSAKNTYGTGCFMLMNVGDKPVFSANGLLTTVACGWEGKPAYALEGSVFSAGSAVQWLRDEMKLISSASESEAAARSVEDTLGVYMVPAFTGLGAPYWNSDARGLICGLTRGAGRNHIIRAVLESIAYQTADILALMERETGIRLDALRVDGGASSNDFLMQFQADIIGRCVERPACVESTALGAACLALSAAGCGDAVSEPDAPDVFRPSMAGAKREALLAGWHEAVSRSAGVCR